MVAFVARGSKPTAGEGGRIGERVFEGLAPTTIKLFARAAAAMSATSFFRRF
jgi:hypothetical protein